MMVEFYMLVGLPASGKSSLAKRMLEKGLVDVVISSDKVREKLYGDESIQGDANKVFRVVKEEILTAMREGKNVAMDATNVNSKKRAAFLADLRARFDGEIDATCCVVAADPIVCVERDLSRGRIVGRAVIERMWSQFEVPYHHEGWDYLTYNCSTTPIDGLQMVNGMVGFDQMNHHHTLDLYQHCFKASVDIKADDTLLRAAAMYHDIGKMYSQTFDKHGEAHYYNHDKMGGYMFLCSDVFERMAETSLKEAMYVALLICWHMQPYFCKNKEEFYKWCDSRDFSVGTANDIWTLHEADLEAH